VDGAAELVNATAIAIAGRAALIQGSSGAGKSDLALRCLAQGASPLLPDAARLVADDWVRVVRTGDRLRAEAPEAILGKLEVRGLGIVTVPHLAEASLVLAVDLVEPGNVPRMPPETAETVSIAGVALPLLRLAPFEASAPLKLKMALLSASPQMPI
jgi:serine kinase of HPr protein (carbohydrate metabolism regulator)